MTDNELIILLRSQMTAAQLAAGYNYVLVKGSQPRQQGTPSQSTFFYQKKWDVPYGFPQTSTLWDPDNQILTEITTQFMQTTFQIGAFALETPGETATPTASDALKMLQLYFSSNTNLRVFNANNVGMYRIQHLSNDYYDNDKSQYEPAPLLELTLTHQTSMTSVIPFTTEIDGRLYAIDSGN